MPKRNSWERQQIAEFEAKGFRCAAMLFVREGGEDVEGVVVGNTGVTCKHTVDNLLRDYLEAGQAVDPESIV